MSTPGDSIQSESALNKSEESTNSATKADPIESNEEASVNNAADVVKKELTSQSVSNGALAESEAKVVANGLETAMNGQEEKPSDGPPRPIPDLLPLAASPTTVPQPTLNAAKSTEPKQTVNSQPITLNTTASPVVATKSATPTPSSPSKTRRRNSSPSVASSSPSKETANASATGKATEGKEEQLGDEKKETKKRKPVAKKRDSIASSDSTEKGDGDSGDGDAGRKSKRARTRTQPYQSSDMDANLLKVIKQSTQTNAAAAAAQQAKLNEEKLVVFFKGEFLAVRNAEGGFYICQAMQNINRGSHKIRIRWLSQAAKEEPKGKRRGKTVETTEPAKDETGFDIYTPDFYDNTDFECILTNLELEKFGKDRYGLPEEERIRTENILRRALEVEQGKVDNLELTEEHPDGLDVSLFHDESQLKRKRRKKAKQTTDDDDNDDDSSSASSSESESDSEEAVATTSGHSRRVSKPAEPEPKTSTSGVASTSSGRGMKRTRAAAARQKIQMRYDDEDTSDDDEDDVSSSDSDGGKRRRGRTSTRRARKVPVAKARAKSAPAARSARGKKLVTPKRGPIPIIKKGPAKTPIKEVATETTSKRRKVAEVQDVKEDKDESSTSEKVVTVDVEMSANEASDDSKPKVEREETTKEPAETAEKPVETAKEEEAKEAQDTKEIEPAKTEETKVAESTEEVEVTPKDNETTAKDAKSDESPKDEVKPSSDESSAKTEPVAAAEAKETSAASDEK